MDNRIAEKIKKMRQELGLTQQELGDLLKKNGQNIANYETRRAMPPVVTYLRLVEVYEQFEDYVKRRKELFKLCG